MQQRVCVRQLEVLGVSDSTAKGYSPWDRQVMHVYVTVLMRENLPQRIN